MSDQLVSFSDLKAIFATMPPDPPGAKKLPNPFIQKYVKHVPAAGKPSPPPLPPSLNLASLLSPDDAQALVALASDAEIVQPGSSTAEALAAVEQACAPLKKNGEVYLDFQRARLAFQFLILRANGMRTKEAILAAGLPDWMPVGILKCHNRAFRALCKAAEERFMATINPHVVDSLVEAAVEGDTVRKFKDGEVVSEAHRANVRAQELVLKATDARFRDQDKGVVASGGVTYNIGSINVAALPPASSAAPALPAAGPAPETIEIGPDSCGFGADMPSVPRGNHA